MDVCCCCCTHYNRLGIRHRNRNIMVNKCWFQIQVWLFCFFKHCMLYMDFMWNYMDLYWLDLSFLLQQNSLAKTRFYNGWKNGQNCRSVHEWLWNYWNTFFIASLNTHASITWICFEYKQCLEFAIVSLPCGWEPVLWFCVCVQNTLRVWECVSVYSAYLQ